MVSGYDATPKPMKQAARVMLAAAVASGAGQSAIAVLDHGVAADGALASDHHRCGAHRPALRHRPPARRQARSSTSWQRLEVPTRSDSTPE